MHRHRPHPGAQSQFACDPGQPQKRKRPMLILSTPEIRALAAVIIRGEVGDTAALSALEGALVRIAEHDALLDQLAQIAAPAPSDPPKVPA